jgi:hypothetical protein
MAGEQKSVTVTEMLPAVPVTVIGTGDGLVSGTRATTPPDQPNILINAVQPIVAIAVRFINTFLTVLVGLVIAGMTPAGGKLLYSSDFFHLVLTCANLSLPAAGLGLIKDLVTVFGKLEGKYPLLTGSV